MTDPELSQERPKRDGTARVVILTSGVALFARLCNLGTFSLWMDEIFIARRARGSLAATWAACVENAEHPPLSALMMYLGRSIGASEDVQRLVPILLGAGSLALIVLWVAEHFGQRVAVVAGLLAAVSPLHIRYSQELRPYAFLLFFMSAALLLADRIGRRPGWGPVAFGAACFAGGLYSHILFPLALIPVGALALSGRSEHEAHPQRGVRHPAICLTAAIGLGLAAFVPWVLSVASALASGRDAGTAEGWTWQALGKRWQFLTVAAREGDPLTWAGWIMAALALAGIVVAARSRPGRVVLVGLAVGGPLVEIVLVALDHRTRGRYDLVAWPFLVIAIALGADRLLALARWPALRSGVVLALVMMHIKPIQEYQSIGRPSWDRMAEVVRRVRRPGELLLAENPWSRLSLGYYVQGIDTLERSNEPDAPVWLERGVASLNQLWKRDATALLVVGRHPANLELRALARNFPLLAEYYSTGALYRLTPEVRQRLWDRGVRTLGPGVSTSSWPQTSLVLLPEDLVRQTPDCLTRFWRAVRPQRRQQKETFRLDFDHSTTDGALVGGWSYYENSPDRTTFVWATGYEVGALLHRGIPEDARIRVRAWAFSGLHSQQRVRGLLNGHVIGEASLGPQPQILEVPAPRSAWRDGENLLVIQFANAAAPVELGGSGDTRPLAAAFDWLEVSSEPAAEER